jgi:hypothetical protein
MGIPVGNYSAFNKIDSMVFRDSGKTYVYNMAGEATSGIAYSVTAGYMFHKNFGVYISYFGSSNNSSGRSYKDITGSSESLPNNASYSYSPGHWRLSSYLIGLSGNIAMNKLEICYRVASGVQTINSPQTSAVISWDEGIDAGISERITQSKLSSSNVVLNGGIDFKYRASKNTAILFSSDYFTSRGSFTGNLYLEANIITIAGEEHLTKSYPMTFNKTASLLSFCVGVEFRIK